MRIDVRATLVIALALAGGAGMLVSCAVPVVAAELKCGTDVVTARGEKSRFEWMARMKVRANWRRRVRAMPGLGPAYADWKKAADLEESCLSGSAGVVCTINGRPCR